MDESRKDQTTTETDSTTEQFAGENDTDNMRQNGNTAGEPVGETEDFEQLKEDLATARQEAADAHDRLLRATAEFDNYKNAPSARWKNTGNFPMKRWSRSCSR